MRPPSAPEGQSAEGPPSLVAPPQQHMPAFQFPPPPPPIVQSRADDDGHQLDFELIRNWAKLSVETMSDRMERYVEYFTPTTRDYRAMVEAFLHELQLGLEAHAERPYSWDPSICSFKMLDSCVKTLPTGKESGVFYAMDFGGTNFRAVRAEMKGGKTIVSQHKQSLLDATSAAHLPKGLLDPRASATKLFDFFALSCKALMASEGDVKGVLAAEIAAEQVGTDPLPKRTDDNGGSDDLVPSSRSSTAPSSQQTSSQQGRIAASGPLKCGFTFSFPCSQRRLNSAVLMEWTKGFETGRETNDPVELLDVAQLADAGFRRKNVPLEVSAVLNDTVGTLLAGCYEMDRKKHPLCLVGLILGTGVNACYYEKEAFDYGYKGRIINLECGNFNRELPLTNVDHEVDFAEISNRGKQRLEKMMSGAYIGEITRRAIVKVLQHLAPEAAWKPFSLPASSMSLVIDDKSSDLSSTATILRDVWGEHKFGPLELRTVHRLCRVVMKRAAGLAAVIVAATTQRTRHLQPAMGGCTVAIDGSLYKCVKYFQKQLRKHLEDILGKPTADLIHLITADDGSGKGASILAATVAAAQ